MQGGLVARYLIGVLESVWQAAQRERNPAGALVAAGQLYERDTGLLAGLRPAHFISIATPHLGCRGQGPSQLPFMTWFRALPYLQQVRPLSAAAQASCGPLHSCLSGAVSQAVSTHALSRTLKLL